MRKEGGWRGGQGSVVQGHVKELELGRESNGEHRNQRYDQIYALERAPWLWCGKRIRGMVVIQMRDGGGPREDKVKSVERSRQVYEFFVSNQ